MAGHGAYHPEQVTVYMSTNLRAALDAQVLHTNTESAQVYIREMLECHFADIRARVRLQRPSSVCYEREPVDELD